MDANELRAEIIRAGMTLDEFAKAIGIGRNALYNRLSGKVDFELKEIQKAWSVLHLTHDDMLRIFFKSKVS